MSFIRFLASKATSIVPTLCPLCDGQAKGGHLCLSCENDLLANSLGARCPICTLPLPLFSTSCPDCAALQPAYDKIISAFDYSHPGDLLIHQFKSGGRLDHARLLSRLLVNAIQLNKVSELGSLVVVPIPSTAAALRRRGFNPAAELARNLARSLRLPCRHDYLYRYPETQAQKQLSRSQRLQEGQQRFWCQDNLPPNCIALVDDVLTTGSTLHSAAQVLKQAGAASVIGFVAARTPYRQWLK